jgi:hypothetical protein
VEQISQGGAEFKPESHRLAPRMSAYGKGERKFSTRCRQVRPQYLRIGISPSPLTLSE